MLLPGPAALHAAFLQRHGLVSVFSVGREEVFTTALGTTMLQPFTADSVMSALSLPPGSTIDQFSFSAIPVDLVFTLRTPDGPLGVVVEVKWKGSPGNAPGYLKYTAHLKQSRTVKTYFDNTPSQLDRAHQIVLSHALSPQGSCPTCGYPQVCPVDGCLRGCRSPVGQGGAPPWVGWPQEYPANNRKVGLQTFLDGLPAPVTAWRFLFLDYADQTPVDFFTGYTCSAAWTSVPMSAFAASLQGAYAAGALSQPNPVSGLEPLLRML